MKSAVASQALTPGSFLKAAQTLRMAHDMIINPKSAFVTDPVVAGLIAKRAELAGIIDQLQHQLNQHRAD